MFTTCLTCTEFDCGIVYRLPETDMTHAVDRAIHVMATVGNVDPKIVRELMPPITDLREYRVHPDNDMIWSVTITKEG